MAIFIYWKGVFIVSLWGFQGVELIVRNEFLILLKVLPDYYSYIQLNCAQKKNNCPSTHCIWCKNFKYYFSLSLTFYLEKINLICKLVSKIIVSNILCDFVASRNCSWFGRILNWYSRSTHVVWICL